MTVTPETIAVELGRTAPVSPTTEQWQAWIGRAYQAIEWRAQQMGVDHSTLDPEKVDAVVTYAVVRRVSRPVDGAESTTDQLGVDDASWQRTRRYPSGLGDIHFLDAWWDLLGLSAGADVFSIQMTGTPDPTIDGPWWP